MRGGYPKLIIDFVDVDSDKWRMYAEYSKFPKALIYKNEWKSLMAYEKKIGKAFDISIFVSDAEVKLFKSFAPDVNAISIPNGVDFSFFYEKQFPERLEHQRANILFTGAMDYFPNEDAVVYFFTEILPYVRKELPNVRFYIVGGNPSKKIKRLAEIDINIVVTDFVSDVRPYLRMADVFVAPLRIARGIQNKVLEAMAAGVPVVARPEAVQGIKECEKYINVESSPLEFSKKVIEIVSDKKIRQILTENALRFVIKNFKWDVNLSRLEKIILQ